MKGSALRASWRLLICGLVLVSAMAIASPRCEAAEDEGLRLGVGYQGVLLPDIVNAASVRAWLQNQFALEANIYHAYVDVDIADADGGDASFLAFTLKGMFAAVANDNSKFYLGVEGGYAKVDVDADTTNLAPDVDTDPDVWMVGPLLGAEYNFTELPELGFNWELGYKFNFVNVDDVDLDLYGLYLSLGVHYYF